MKFGGARKRRDASEPAIVATLKAAGWSVQQLHIPGGPDLLCGAYDSFVGLAEVKSGRKNLRDRQTEWHRQWRGGRVRLLRTAEDALSWVRDVTKVAAG